MEYITEDVSKLLLLVELQNQNTENLVKDLPCPCIVVSDPDFVNVILNIDDQQVQCYNWCETK